MNTYFDNVVKEAIEDLKLSHLAYVFYREQVEEIIIKLEKIKWFEGKELLIKEENGIFTLKLKTIVDKKEVLC